MNDTKPGYYAVIPAEVRYDTRLPANAKLLYGEISALIGADGFCYASNQYFSELYGMAEETISRLIAKLEKTGHILRQLIRDDSGQVTQRRLYLRVSVPDGQPLDENVNTSPQKNQEGIDEKVKDTNLSITNIEKENKKEKAKALTDEELRQIFVGWISTVGEGVWKRQDKNQVYFALMGFYESRHDRKKEPARSKAAVSALTNRLARYSGGDPAIMIDMLERATTAGWKSVFPLNDSRKGAPEKSGGEAEIWLN